MLEKIMMASLAVGVLALNAPAASAGHQTASCRFNAVSQSAATGEDTWEGHAQGYLIGNPGEGVTVRCVVRVGGTVGAVTAWGSGPNGVATTADRVTFVATDTQVVTLCAQYTTSHGAGETCFATAPTQVPPQEVIDAIGWAIGDISFSPCPELALLNGDYGNGAIVIRPGSGGGGGDVYVNGELWYDCPQYEP